MKMTFRTSANGLGDSSFGVSGFRATEISGSRFSISQVVGAAAWPGVVEPIVGQ
jgi:hypothetical protein